MADATKRTPAEIASRPGLLIQVRDNFGRSLKFAYIHGLLSKMIDPAGQEFNYELDPQLRLNQVIWPDGFKRQDLNSVCHAMPHMAWAWKCFKVDFVNSSIR